MENISILDIESYWEKHGTKNFSPKVNDILKKYKKSIDKSMEESLNYMELSSKVMDLIDWLMEKLENVSFMINLLSEDDYKEFDNFIEEYSKEHNIDISEILELEDFKATFQQIEYNYNEDIFWIMTSDIFPHGYINPLWEKEYWNPSYGNFQRLEKLPILIETLKERYNNQ